VKISQGFDLGVELFEFILLGTKRLRILVSKVETIVNLVPLLVILQKIQGISCQLSDVVVNAPKVNRFQSFFLPLTILRGPQGVNPKSYEIDVVVEP